MKKQLTVPELKKLVEHYEGLTVKLAKSTVFIWPSDDDSSGDLSVYLMTEGGELFGAVIAEAELYEWLRVRQDR